MKKNLNKSVNKKKKRKCTSVRRTHMPCQNYKMDLKQLFFEDRKTHKLLTQNYLNKMNTFQKDTLKINKKYIDIKQKHNLLKKTNKRILIQNEKLIRKNKKLEKQNLKMKNEFKKILKNFHGETKYIKSDFEKEKEFFHLYYQKKISELRKFYSKFSKKEKKENFCDFSNVEILPPKFNDLKIKENITFSKNNNIENFSKSFKNEENVNFANFMKSTKKKDFFEKKNVDLLKMYKNRQKIEENLEDLQKEISLIKSLK